MRHSFTIRPASYLDAFTVAERMRQWDRRECYAGLSEETPEALARLTGHSRYRWCAFHKRKPVAVFGAQELEPTQWRVWLYATDRWPLVALRVSLWFRQHAVPTLLNAGANRAECYSIDGHSDAHAWLSALGAEQSGPLVDRGKNRETFWCFAWTRTEFDDERRVVDRTKREAGRRDHPHDRRRRSGEHDR